MKSASLSEQAYNHEPFRTVSDESSFGATSLMVSAFRNLQSLDLSIAPSPLILTAHNGTGKTNILEALSLFSPGKGLRSAKFSDIQQQGQSYPWQVGMTFMSDGEPLHLGTAFINDGATEKRIERRIVKYQGEPLKTQAALTDYLNVVWFTPSMGALFCESGQIQRQFVDRLVFGFDALHAKRRSTYDKVMRERNTILKDYGPTSQAQWLEPIEEKLADLGYAILHARHSVLKALEDLQSTTPLFPRFTASMEGEAETLYQHIQSKDACIQAFREQLLRSRPLDAIKGSTKTGPHRSKFHVVHLSKKMPAEFCSTGEQKMLVLAIILAFVKMESSKGLLLLLDDVVDHLDAQHRSVLIQDIMHLSAKKKSQVWMTGTDPKVFAAMEHHAQFLNETHLMSL